MMKKQGLVLMFGLALSTTTSAFCMEVDQDRTYIEKFCKKNAIDPNSVLDSGETILENTYNHYKGRLNDLTPEEVPLADFHLTYLYYLFNNSQGKEFDENSPVLRGLFTSIPKDKRYNAFRTLSLMLGDSIVIPGFRWDLGGVRTRFWDYDSQSVLLQELLALPYEPLQKDQ